jgi:cytidylate kinase
VTWLSLELGLDLQNQSAVAAAARNAEFRFQGGQVFVNGRDLTSDIRLSAVTSESRHIAANNEVRAFLIELQRKLAGNANVVTEGRDQGTIAFPHAECKFFLTASPEERARRRQKDLARNGEHVPLDEILAQQAGRDQRDEAREFGALKPASDAILIDTSGRDFDDVLVEIEQIVSARLQSQANRCSPSSTGHQPKRE